MPYRNQIYLGPAGQLAPQVLEASGPILQVEIHVPGALALVMANTNQAIPPPATGCALIDTGATRSAVDEAAVQQLGVQPVGRATGWTASGPVVHNLYPVRFMFPGWGLDLDFSQATGVNLTGQQAGGHPIVALIGRDVLSRCLLVYNGAGGFFTLGW